MTNYAITSRGKRTQRACQPFMLLLLTALAILIPRIGAAQSTTYGTIYSFNLSPDGGEPEGALVIGKNGALYGTTYGGGASGLGTVFELTKPAGGSWQENVLYSFSGSDGQNPESPLVFGNTGALYGVTVGGGGEGSTGVAFELAPPSAAGGAWTDTVLYVFSGSIENSAPNGPLLFGPGGTLYATTRSVTDESGLVVALQPPTTPAGAWTESVLYSFGGPPAGKQPFAGVVSEGRSLFGTTGYGGDKYCIPPDGCGIIYELTPPATLGSAWTESTLYTFTGGSDGELPEAPLAIGPGGALYGTTYYGGSGVCYVEGGFLTKGCGAVFQLTPPSSSGAPWTYSVIYNFTGADGDGAAPVAGVAVGKDGAIYGTTPSGGSAASASACLPTYHVIAGCGIVFELTPPPLPGGAWTETILHSFSGTDGDGAIPLGSLTLSSAGILYGTTSAGGTAGRGTVFAIVP